jgi:hypothetical protein
MSIYEPSPDPSSPNYSVYAYIDQHPPESVRIQRAEDAAKVEAVRIAEGNKLLAKLREQDRASTGEMVLSNDVIHAEQGFPEPEPLTVDEPVNTPRLKAGA